MRFTEMIRLGLRVLILGALLYGVGWLVIAGWPHTLYGGLAVLGAIAFVSLWGWVWEKPLDWGA